MKTLPRIATVTAFLISTSLFVVSNSFAACSSYLDTAYFNEYYFGTAGTNYLEAYIPNNNKVLASDMENWSIKVYGSATPQTYSLNSSVANYCTFGSKTFITYDVPAGLPGEGSDINVVLLDGSGNEIDYLKFSKQTPTTEWVSPQCSYSANHDIDFTAPNFGNKDIARFPDGRGDWSISSLTGANTSYTQCQSNDAGLTKEVSAASIPVNTIESFTITANNPGNQSVSSVSVTDTWPAGLIFDSASTTSGSYDSATGVWTLGTLAKNTSATLTINFHGDTPGSYENQATLQYSDNKGTYTTDAFATAEIVPPIVTTPDHFEFEHDGSGLTCSPESITVRACQDAACTTEYPDPITATLAPTGWVGGNTQTFSSGDTLQLWYTSVGTPTLDVTSSSSGATNPPRCFVAGVEQASCAMPFYDSGFLFDVPDHTAAVSQNITLSAVRSSDNSLQCTPAFTNVSKTVNFWSGYGDPATGTQAISINGSAISGATPGTGLPLNFDANGQTQLSVSYPDVGNMVLNAQYSGSSGTGDTGLLMSGQDTFVARPDHFGIGSLTCSDGTTNPAAATATGNTFCAAGQNFNLTIASYNAAGAITPNYGNESVPESVALTPTLVLPSGGNNPALNGSLGNFAQDCSGNPTTAGTACGTFNWPEVGIITLTPSIADGSYLGAGNVSGSVSTNVGRFYADHFNLALSGADFAPANGNFTYLGQNFQYATAPNLAVTAASAGGITLQNYQGNFWKLGSDIVADSTITNCQSGNYSCFVYSDNAGFTTLNAPTIPITFSDYITTSSFAGSDTLSGIQGTDNFSYAKPINPIAPFDGDIQLQVYLEDSDGASGSALLSSIGFSSLYESDPSGTAFNTTNDMLLRFGRAALSDTIASGTTSGTTAYLPLDVQYYDGIDFVSNADDTTTSVTHSSAAPALSCTDPDTTGDTLSCAVASIQDPVTVTHPGNFPISLTSNINNSGGTLLYELYNTVPPSYLGYDWNGDGTIDSTDMASASVTFAPPSYYHGDKRFIYWQEQQQ